MARMRLTNAGKVGRPKSMFTEPGDVDELAQTTQEMRTNSLQEVSSDRLYNDTENQSPIMVKGTENGRRNALVRRARTFGAADVRPKVERQKKPENDDCSDCFRCSRARASSDPKDRKASQLRRSTSDDKPSPAQSNEKIPTHTNERSNEKKKVSDLTDVELKKFCRYFWRSDVNGSGKLTVYDFNKLIQHLGMKLNKESLHQAFKIADVDHDGFLSFNDFSVTYLKRDTATLLPPQQVKQLFSKHNAYSNSAECIFLSKAECVQLINMLGNDFDVFRFDRALRSMMDNKEKIALVSLYSFLGYEL